MASPMPNEIKTIAVIGATDKGRAIVEAALRAGYGVVLEDVVEARLNEVARSLGEAAPHASARLVLAATMEDALRDADLVIEALPDELEMKLELFTIFDKFAKPEAILVSSTESLSIDDLAEMTVFPERCIGFRFAGANKVQLRRAPRTANETIAACTEIARRMGKEVALTPALGGSRLTL